MCAEKASKLGVAICRGGISSGSCLELFVELAYMLSELIRQVDMELTRV